MAEVSIIVPVYNSGKYLRSCINSLLNQTLKDIEIILVDDASTDDSLEILNCFKQEYPNRIKVVQNSENSGAGYSRNIGLKYASGKFIGFVDSDDYIEPHMYENMYNTMINGDYDVVTTGMNLEYKGKDLSFLSTRKICLETEKNKFFVKTNPSCCNKLYKASILKELSFPEKTKWEDFPFTLSAISLAKSFKCLNSIDYHYRVNAVGTTCTDLLKVSPRILDIFTCCDILEENMKKNRSFDELQSELRDIQIINSVSRIRDLLFVTMSLKRKKELINLLSKLIEIKYGFWQENEKYIDFKNNSNFYKMRMKCIEELFIDDKLIKIEDENEIKAKIRSIVSK